MGGTAAVAARMALPDSDPIAVAFLRHVGVGLILAGLAWGPRGSRRGIARADLLPIAALGLLQFTIYGALFVWAFNYVTAARGALVLATMPLAALVIGAALGRESPTTLKVVGCATALAGVAIALLDRASGGPEAWKGDLIMAMSVLTGAFYAVVSQPYIRRNPSLPVAAFAILVGAAGLFALVVAAGSLANLWSFGVGGWLAVLWLVGPAGVIPFYLWNWALERAPPSRVTIAITLNPLAAAAFGAAVLGEAVTANLLAGLIAVVAGIALANRQTRA